MSAARVLAAAGLLCVAAAAPAAAAGTLALDSPEGRVIAALTSVEGYGADVGNVVARYDDAGVLDPAFGIDGYTRAAGQGLLRRTDGRIVTYNDPRADLFCCRPREVWQHLPDGSLDGAFGEGGGRLALELQSATAAALAPGGEILIADSPPGGVRVRRIEPDGTLDPGFAAAGPPGIGAGVNDVHVTAEGILVGGEDWLMRFTHGGRLDETFADGGVLRVHSRRSLVTDAGIVLLGIDQDALEPAWVATRLHADGTRDAGWGDDGRRRLAQDPYDFCCATGGALAEGPGGTVLAATTVVGASPEPGIAVTRLTPTGDVDASYGSGGSTVFEIGFRDSVGDIVALPSGAAVVADHIRDPNGSYQRLGLARLTASGTLDPSFAGDGKLATAFDVSGPGVRIDAQDFVGASATFAFSSPGDAVGFKCALDSAAPVPCESPARYDALREGAHRFNVEAFDRRGNASVAGYVMDYWVVNTRPPDTSLALAPAPVERRAVVRFDLAADEAVRAFYCSLDGVALGGCPANMRVRVAEGEHVFEAQAVDAWGAADPTPVVYRFRVDFTAPDTRIDAGPPAVTRERSAAVAFSSSDDTAAFECRVNGGAWAPCASPLHLADLQPGVHGVQVRAVDTAGNADAAGAERLWRVEEQPAEAERPPAEAGPPLALEVLAARRTLHRAGGARGLLARLRVHNPLGRRGTIRLCATYPRGWRSGTATRRLCLPRSVAADGDASFRLKGRPPRRPRSGTLRYSVAFPGLPVQRGTSRWVARR